jgi:hypothetical protein
MMQRLAIAGAGGTVMRVVRLATDLAPRHA